MKDFPNSGWAEKPLGEVVTVTKTKGGSRPLPYVGLEDISSDGTGEFTGSLKPQGDKSTTFEFGPRHLLYGRLRPYLNKVYRPDFEGHCSSEIFPMLPDECLDRGYLFHWITSDRVVEKINATSTGARMPRANVKEILQFPIPVPPLVEQQRIVAILDEAFEGLARARAHAEANLQNARELFDAQLSAIFRKIDAGQKKPLGDVCDFVRGPFGGSLKKAIFKPSGYAVYEQQHAIRDQFEDFRYFIDDAKFAEMARFRVEAGDLIMSCSGTMGKVAIVPEGAPDGIINQALLKLRPSEELRAEFLKRWMQSDDFQDQLSANTMGVAIKNVASVKTLKTLLAVVPSLEEQDNIVGRSEEAEEQFVAITQSYEAKLEDLDDLRQSLLQKAFAGELT